MTSALSSLDSLGSSEYDTRFSVIVHETGVTRYIIRVHDQADSLLHPNHSKSLSWWNHATEKMIALSIL